MLNAYSPGLGGRARVQRVFFFFWGGDCVSRSHGGASHQMPLSGGPSHTLASVKWSGFTSQWNLLGTPCLWPSMMRQAPGAAQFSAAHRDGVGADVGSSSDGGSVVKFSCGCLELGERAELPRVLAIPPASPLTIISKEDGVTELCCKNKITARATNGLGDARSSYHV